MHPVTTTTSLSDLARTPSHCHTNLRVGRSNRSGRARFELLAPGETVPVTARLTRGTQTGARVRVVSVIPGRPAWASALARASQPDQHRGQTLELLALLLGRESGVQLAGDLDDGGAFRGGAFGEAIELGLVLR